jgi:hypothetical protein
MNPVLAGGVNDLNIRIRVETAQDIVAMDRSSQWTGFPMVDPVLESI